MRLYVRTSRNTGISVGVIGALLLLTFMAYVWLFVAVVAVVSVAIVIVVGTVVRIRDRAHRRRVAGNLRH